MKDVRTLAQEIVGREGGYGNDPDDPGGATKYGVTIGRMQALNMDLTGDGQVTSDDVKALSREQAVDIFIEHYFNRPRIDALPEIIQPSVFDMQVNAGNNAIKILQRLLNDMGIACAVDGAIGPQTAAAAARAAELAPAHFVDAYGIARRNYYYAIGDGRAASRKYARRRDGGKGGWIRRAEEFISRKYHYSRTEHNRRVSAWG